MQPNNSYYGGSMTQMSGYPTQSNNRRKLILIVMGILVVLTAIFGVISTLGGGGSSKAPQLFSYIKSGDGAKSYDLLSSDAKTVIPKEDWVKTIIELKGIIGNNEPKLVYTEKSDNLQTIYAYNVGQTGSIYRINVAVNPNNGTIESISYNQTTL